MKPRALSALQMDALRETGNIGAGRAAQALSRLLGRTVRIDVPRISVVALADLPGALEAGRTPGAVVHFRVSGAAPGRLLLWADAAALEPLIGGLLGRRAGDGPPLGPESVSALKEMGNILCGGYLNALAEWAGVALLPSVPALAPDLAGALSGPPAGEGLPPAAEALLLENRLAAEGLGLSLTMVYIPTVGALDALLDALARRTGVDLRGDRG